MDVPSGSHWICHPSAQESHFSPFHGVLHLKWELKILIVVAEYKKRSWLHHLLAHPWLIAFAVVPTINLASVALDTLPSRVAPQMRIKKNHPNCSILTTYRLHNSLALPGFVAVAVLTMCNFAINLANVALFTLPSRVAPQLRIKIIHLNCSIFTKSRLQHSLAFPWFVALAVLTTITLLSTGRICLFQRGNMFGVNQTEDYRDWLKGFS